MTVFVIKNETPDLVKAYREVVAIDKIEERVILLIVGQHDGHFEEIYLREVKSIEVN